MSIPFYEKLGAFYLGKGYDLDEGSVKPDLVLYDSKDLCTHAVLVGMTGSGKTGLGVTLIEEAAIDRIPVIVIDPKGDMANLLLNFPNLESSDFRPWVQAGDADRQGVTVDEYAEQQASLWKNGLAEWDQGGERVKLLRDSAEFTVYTPGSESGIPISILSSFAAPSTNVLDDADLMRDRVSTTATSILSMLGIDADPVRSREHILLTTIFDHCWRKGQSLDLGAIIRLVQSPPVSQIGVMDLESFYPSKDRFELAMAINNLLAAPGFRAWTQGEPMDVDSLLYTAEGKPRVSIFSIAHLSDSERLFFVSLLLNETISWMRSRSGTSSLRAMLYIDEIFGYMPPVAEPPTKKPLLTLLKQARAFGVGVVLATQNPVDLDYKGLSNTGTWFIGRLQTERDKLRVLDGLEGASTESGGSFDRATISEVLSNVGKRVFLMHNVHEDGPAVFHSRWALSYLAGPMTRDHIKRLMDGREVQHEDRHANVESDKLTSASPRPMLDPKVPELFLPVQRRVGDAKLVYRPHLVSVAKVQFVDTRRGLSAQQDFTLLTTLDDDLTGVDWAEAGELALVEDDFQMEPEDDASYAALLADAGKVKSYAGWEKDLADYLYRNKRYALLKSPVLREYSEPGEAERDFRIRLSEKAHAMRDEALEKLRKKYASKIRTLEDRIARAEQKVQVERQQASGAKMQTAISWGATILSAVMGRKKFGVGTIGRATTAARGMGRQRKQEADVVRAEERLMRYEEQLMELEGEIEQESDLIHDKFDPLTEELDTIQLKPRKSDIDIRTVALAWAPFALFDDGSAQQLFN